MKRLFFVAGEASGDACGAALIEALRAREPNLEIAGRGGPLMRALAGEAFVDWIADAAVVGLWEVLRRYPYFRREFRATLDAIWRFRPDAVVTIDYPGFNLRLAAELRRGGFQGRLIHYVSPQVWAWNRSRMPGIAKSLDLLLCIFPFEPALWEPTGLRTVFVGNPLVERLEKARTGEAREAGLVALLPGSRSREVQLILPVMVEAARALAERRPGVRFEIGAPSERLAARAREMVGTALPGAEVQVGDAHGLMQRASAGMVASGTATMEATLFRMPYVLVYRVHWFTYLAARAVVKVPHLGMANILAGREVVPEFIQEKAVPGMIADAVGSLLGDGEARLRMLDAFEQVVETLGGGGAAGRAAEAVLGAAPERPFPV